MKQSRFDVTLVVAIADFDKIGVTARTGRNIAKRARLKSQENRRSA